MDVDLDPTVLNDRSPSNQHLLICLFAMKYKIDIAVVDYMYDSYDPKKLIEPPYTYRYVLLKNGKFFVNLQLLRARQYFFFFKFGFP